MQDIHVLVDLENNQPTLDEVRALVPNLTDAWLFHSRHQSKRLHSFEAMGARMTAVPITRPGKNSLDFHLSFYLGYIAQRNPGAKLVVVAIDNGYGPMILHARELGFDVQKVAFRPHAKPSKPAKKVVLKKAPAAKKMPVAKTPAAKKPAAVANKPADLAKKAPAKKVPAGKKAPARKLPAAKKPPAKKAASVSSPNAKTVAGKSPPPRAVVRATGKATAQPTAKKVLSSLSKMGSARPNKLKPFLQHIGSLIGLKPTDAAVTRLVSELKRAGAVTVSGDAVSYPGL
jgi:hypothetical protein